MHKEQDEYSEIYEEVPEGIILEKQDDYDDVYDEDGGDVICPMCDALIKYIDYKYTCPECGYILERKAFFEYIGAEPPGEECLTCRNLYPGCTICPHGYVED